jgi:hypothetical protein
MNEHRAQGRDQEMGMAAGAGQRGGMVRVGGEERIGTDCCHLAPR